MKLDGVQCQQLSPWVHRKKEECITQDEVKHMCKVNHICVAIDDRKWTGANRHWVGNEPRVTGSSFHQNFSACFTHLLKEKKGTTYSQIYNEEIMEQKIIVGWEGLLCFYKLILQMLWLPYLVNIMISIIVIFPCMEHLFTFNKVCRTLFVRGNNK